MTKSSLIDGVKYWATVYYELYEFDKYILDQTTHSLTHSDEQFRC